jgi:hypothetical protein
LLEVVEYAVEGVYSADPGVGSPRTRVERHAELVESSVDQGTSILGRQGNRIGVEEHAGTPRLEVGDHSRQLAVQEWLTDAVKEHAVEDGELVDDLAKLLPGQIALGLSTTESQYAGLTQRVAPARGL